ncbi:MAG: RibD family protein [Anaerolineales bacterium]|nr:RibD family protein [Anaerolineales bacterium]
MIPLEQLLENAESHRRQSGLPLVTLSYAQSLDGSITAKRGKPLALSGPESTRITHQLRALHDAILVGIGTILADDPQLTVRLVEGKNPRPVILDSALRIPLGARLLQRRENIPWVAAIDSADVGRQKQLEKMGVRVLRFPQNEEGNVSIHLLLERLAKEGINRLMVEGGARVIGAFLAAGLVDRAVITIAPCFVGGLPAVELGNSFSMTEFPLCRLREMRSEMAGHDLVIWGKVINEKKRIVNC